MEQRMQKWNEIENDSQIDILEINGIKINRNKNSKKNENRTWNKQWRIFVGNIGSVLYIVREQKM